MKTRVMFICIFLFTTICCSFNNEEVTNNNINEPPNLTLIINNEKLNAVMGSHSWSTIDDNGNGTSYGSDSVTLPDLLEYQSKEISVKPNTEVVFEFESQPLSYSVNIWNVNELNKMEVVNDKIVIPEYEGILIFEISANWTEGQVNYAFSLNVE